MKLQKKIISFILSLTTVAAIVPTVFAVERKTYNFDGMNVLPEYVSGKNLVSDKNLRAEDDAVLAEFWAPFCRVDVDGMFEGEILNGAEYRIKCDVKTTVDSPVAKGNVYIALTDESGNIIYNYADKNGSGVEVTKGSWKNITLYYTYKSGEKPRYVSILTLDETDATNSLHILIDNVSVNQTAEGSNELSNSADGYDAAYNFDDLNAPPAYAKSRLLKPNNTYWLDTEEGHSGSQSMRVRYWASYVSIYFTDLFTAADVKAGDKVLLSGYVKLNDETSAFDEAEISICIHGPDTSTDDIIANGGLVTVTKDDWTKIELEYEIPADKTPYGILVRNATANTSETNSVYLNIDDIAITNLSNSNVQSSDGRLKLTDTLGITPELFSTAFSANSKVTRGEFAKFMLAFYNVENKKVQEAPFSDVSVNDDFAYAASLLKSKGIMNGYPDGTFRPDSVISCGEAITVIVSQLGYGFYAQNTGGYPNGYLTTAHKLKFTDKLYLDAYSPLTQDVLLSLYVNALDCAVPEQNVISGDTISFTFSEKTLLEDVFGIRHSEGIITGTERTHLNTESRLSDTQIAIGGITYECIDSALANELCEYLGYYVDFYYGTEGETEDRIIYAAPNPDENEVLVITKENYDDSDGNYIYYFENSKRRKVKVEFGADIIYNGMSYSGTENVFDINAGSITLIKADSDTYDTIIVRDIYSYVVESVDSIGEYINPKFVNDRIIAGENKHNAVVEIRKPNGKPMELSQIKPDNVIEVMKSKGDMGKKVIEIIVSSNTVTGTVESVDSSEANKAFAIIDGKKYSVTNEYLQWCDAGLCKRLGIGTELKIYLNSSNAIVAVGAEIGSLQFGYIVSGMRNITGDKVFYAKLLTEDSSIEKYDFADRIKFNGYRYDYDDSVFDSLCTNNRLNRQLIRYQLNGEGKINMIQTVKNNSVALEPEEGEICKIADYSAGVSTYRNGYFGRNKYNLMPNTVVFKIPISDSSKGEEYFTTGGIDSFYAGHGYQFDAYSVSGTYNNMDVVILDSGNITKSESNVTNTTELFVISSIGYSINDDGEPILLLKGKLGREDKTVKIIDERATKSPAFSKGDVIMFEEDLKGEVRVRTNGTYNGADSNFVYVIDADGNNGNPLNINNYIENTNSSYTHLFRPLYTMNDYVWCAEQATVSAFEQGTGSLLPDACFDTSSMIVMVYDMDNEDLIDCSIGATEFYNKTTKKGAYILTHVRKQSPYMCIVYQ